LIINPYFKIVPHASSFLFLVSFPQFNLSETQYQLHAKEVANSLDLSKYDGIVCVSGDGLLVEVG
jgi:diacylglycerol kinase family enzyme